MPVQGNGIAVKHRCSGRTYLTKGSVDFGGVISHDYRFVDYDNRRGHEPKLSKIINRSWILGYIPLGEPNTFLRKILFRLVAENSTILAVNGHCIHFVISP